MSGETVATVSQLFVYPIKACRGIAVSTMRVGPTGPIGDRQWQIVDARDGESAQPVTQRTAPGLATVVVEQVGDGLRLSVDGPGPVGGSVDVGAPGLADVSVSPLLGDEVPAADAGDEVADWLAAIVGHPVRLAARTSTTDRRNPGEFDMWDQEVSFVDISPVVVANQASADWLAARASEPFAMDRFRSNIVVEGAPAWAEDTWENFAIGSAELTSPQPWPRCAVPQVDQLTGDRHREPALVMKQHRWCSQAPSVSESLQPLFVGSALFAIGCGLGPVGAEVNVGDPVVVSATRTPMIAAPDDDN